MAKLSLASLPIYQLAQYRALLSTSVDEVCRALAALGAF